MSKGNPIIQARVPRYLLDNIDERVSYTGRRKSGKYRDRSAFIVEAIRGKLLEDYRVLPEPQEPQSFASWAMQWARWNERRKDQHELQG
jgi:hypothetical protein